VSFFDDDAEVTQVTPPAPRSRRKRTNRSRLRIQRLVIALIALFVVVFVLALVVRSCQQNAKESSYRTYFSEVQSVQTQATKNVDQPLAALLADPTRYGKTELTSRLKALVSAQSGIAKTTDNISPPGKLKSLHEVLKQGQQVRLDGVKLASAGLLAALSGKNLHGTARKLAALSGYFTGPAVYYSTLYRTQAQNVMKKDGVSNVEVPPGASFAKAGTLFSAAALQAALASISSSTTLTGVHGVSLDGVAIKSNGKTVTLAAGASTHFTASVDQVVLVTVKNPGKSAETNVAVKVVWVAPDGTASAPLTATIPSLPVGATRTAQVTNLSIPTTAITKASTLKVSVGPVPGEKVLSNNHASFVIVPVLK
jgi:hypothetical protein